MPAHVIAPVLAIASAFISFMLVLGVVSVWSNMPFSSK